MKRNKRNNKRKKRGQNNAKNNKNTTKNTQNAQNPQNSQNPKSAQNPSIPNQADINELTTRLIAAKQGWIQTAIELRNIALQINTQVTYRFEMLISLLEVSLETLPYTETKLRNNTQVVGGFKKYEDIKTFVDNSLLKFNYDCHLLVSEFTNTVSNKLFHFFLPKKRPKKIKQFLQKWAKIDQSILEIINRVNKCDSRTLQRSRKAHAEFEELLEMCNMKKMKFNGCFDFLVEDDLKSLVAGRKDYEYYDPELQEGFEERVKHFFNFLSPDFKVKRKIDFLDVKRVLEASDDDEEGGELVKPSAEDLAFFRKSYRKAEKAVKDRVNYIANLRLEEDEERKERFGGGGDGQGRGGGMNDDIGDDAGVDQAENKENKKIDDFEPKNWDKGVEIGGKEGGEVQNDENLAPNSGALFKAPITSVRSFPANLSKNQKKVDHSAEKRKEMIRERETSKSKLEGPQNEPQSAQNIPNSKSPEQAKSGSGLSQSVLLSQNKAKGYRRDPQISAKSHSILSKTRISSVFIFQFLTINDLKRASKDRIKATKFFKMRSLSLNDNVVSPNALCVIGKSKYLISGSGGIFEVDELKKEVNCIVRLSPHPSGANIVQDVQVGFRGRVIFTLSQKTKKTQLSGKIMIQEEDEVIELAKFYQGKPIHAPKPPKKIPKIQKKYF